MFVWAAELVVVVPLPFPLFVLYVPRGVGVAISFNLITRTPIHSFPCLFFSSYFVSFDL